MADFSELSAITNALYQTELAQFQAVTAEEDSLQKEMKQLEDEVRRAEALADDGAMALRQLGCDLLWKAWVGRKRQMLNLKLANLIAKKQVMLSSLQRSFGKKSITQELDIRARREQHAMRTRRALVEEQTQMVLTASRSHQS